MIAKSRSKEATVGELANLLVEITWEVSPRTKAHAALQAAIRALGGAPADFADAAKQLARAERILLYHANLDAAYRVLRRDAGRGAPRVARAGSRFDALAAALGAGRSR